MILLDTCALLWTVNGDPLAPAATRAISQATRAGSLFLSPISAWEIGLLASRRKLDLPSPPEVFVAALFARPGVRLASFTPEVATRASFLPGDLHHDPADRILVATALELGLRLVTRDRRLLAYGSAGYLSVLAC